ncbi:CHAT domain-containing protein [Mycena latifolia]|nr:CHAT domain-containing protein [Mycena latifolia]
MSHCQTHIDTGQPGAAPSSNRMAAISGHAADSEAAEAADTLEFATRLLKEWKDPIHSSDLNTAIFLLDECLDAHPPPDPQRAEILVTLLNARLMRFASTYTIEDIRRLRSDGRELQSALADLAEYDVEVTATDENIDTASSILEEIRRSIDVPALETIIFMHHEALSSWPLSSQTRWMPQNGLCDALSMGLIYGRKRPLLEEYIGLAQELWALKPSYHHHLLIAHALRSTVGQDFTPDPWREYTNIWGQMISMSLNAKFMDAAAVTMAQSGQLDAAIKLFTEADDLLAFYQTERPVLLGNWASALRERCGENGQQVDLDASIALYRRAIFFPCWEGRPVRLEALANALLERFKLSGRKLDVDEAIELHREALPEFTAPVHRCSALRGFAEALDTRFKLTQQLADANCCIELFREALSPTYRHVLSDSDQGQSLVLLGTMLYVRFMRLGGEADLDAAIRSFEQSRAVLPLSNVNRCALLDHLAVALLVRFHLHAESDDIQKAVTLARQALEIWPVGRPEKDSCIANLATMLHERFIAIGAPVDLDESIKLHRQALELRPPPHPKRPESLGNLSNALVDRFRLYGRTVDREEAAQFYRSALGLSKASNSQDTGNFAENNLSGLLSLRFEQLDMAADSDVAEAVRLARAALEARPQNHPNRVTALHNLAHALSLEFHLHGQVDDLDEAIQLLRQGLNLHHGARRPLLLMNLAVYLHARYEKTGQQDDLDAMIAPCEELQTRWANYQEGKLRLIHLNHVRAARLHSLYKKNRDPVLLDRAVKLTHSVLESIPKNYTSYGVVHVNLGQALIDLSNFTGDPIYIWNAIKSFRSVAENDLLPLHQRLQAARYWASQADSIAPESALTAYEYAIGLLPKLAMAGHDLRARQRALQSSSGLGSDGLGPEAATCAIHQKKIGKAVELLETARSIFWSQALQLRAPVEELRRVRPAMAARLADIADQLEKGALRDTSRETLASGAPELLLMEEETARYRKLNDDWVDTIQTIRRDVPGFQNFLRPKPLEELRKAAKDGPVVMLVISKKSCHALIVTSNRNVQCVELTELSPEYVATLASTMRSITRGQSIDEAELRDTKPGSNTRLAMTQERNMEPEDALRLVLQRLWEWVVKPVVDSLKLTVSTLFSRCSFSYKAFQKTNNPARLWWCPTGPFAFLPIHAAGVYGEPTANCISNYVISSYTPTLALLLRPFSVMPKPFKMTAIIQPNTPGFNALASTRTELQKIKTRVPDMWLTALGDRAASPADITTVLNHLKASAIVHFACHGHQDHHNPLESSLVLQNGERLKMSQIMERVRPVEGSNNPMSFVFLAACETAQGQEAQPDEAMHLAATLLFAGFGGAVATMWTMEDSDGPKIADTFYEHLFQGTAGEPDLKHTASALRAAVQKLRMSGNVPFIRWVPFVHFGL